jgi:hypothetical protein
MRTMNEGLEEGRGRKREEEDWMMMMDEEEEEEEVEEAEEEEAANPDSFGPPSLRHLRITP